MNISELVSHSSPSRSASDTQLQIMALQLDIAKMKSDIANLSLGRLKAIAPCMSNYFFVTEKTLRSQDERTAALSETVKALQAVVDVSRQELAALASKVEVLEAATSQ